MKTNKMVLLIIVVMLYALNNNHIKAAVTPSFTSTSSMMTSQSGYGEYQSAADFYEENIVMSHGPRRIGADGDGEDSGEVTTEEEERPESWQDPMPIGDGVWVLILLAGAYLGSKKLLRKAQL